MPSLCIRTCSLLGYMDIPGGAWKGAAYHWLLYRKSLHFDMCLWRLEREFWGYGKDADGAFTIQGTCEAQTGLVQFTKHYRVSHKVRYYGYFDGNEIQGLWYVFLWEISVSGPFQMCSGERDANESSGASVHTPNPPWECDCPRCGGRLTLRPKPGHGAACTLCQYFYDPLHVRIANFRYGTAVKPDHIPRPCRRCSYDLTGLPDIHRCPECGCRYDLIEQCLGTFFRSRETIESNHNAKPCQQCGNDLARLPDVRTCPECGCQLELLGRSLYSGHVSRGRLKHLRWFLIFVALGLLLTGFWAASAYKVGLTRDSLIFSALLLVAIGVCALAYDWVNSVLLARCRAQGENCRVTALNDNLSIIAPGVSKQIPWGLIGCTEYRHFTRRLIVRNTHGTSIVSIRLPPRDSEEVFRGRKVALDIRELARVYTSTGRSLNLEA